jgi:hypothetical protein
MLASGPQSDIHLPVISRSGSPSAYAVSGDNALFQIMLNFWTNIATKAQSWQNG